MRCIDGVRVRRLLGVLGVPPSSLSLQRRFLRIARDQDGVYWRDGQRDYYGDGTAATIGGPFASTADALHDACVQSNPAEKILLVCLREIQKNAVVSSTRCLSSMRVLSLLFIEGITPSEVMVQMVQRLVREPLQGRRNLQCPIVLRPSLAGDPVPSRERVLTCSQG